MTLPGDPSMPFGAEDLEHMQHALHLAAQGEGRVEPNPMVGCVIARGAQRIAEGCHRRFGGPHAEVEALEQAGDNARGATLYVTLEPCCHHGKTPPCTDAILRAGIARVVIAQLDPYPEVAGQGIERLRDAGVQVEQGLLSDPAQKLNAPYIKRLTTGRPWVLAKWAMTLDGKLAARSGQSRWISSEASRKVAHDLRRRMDGVMVGLRTVQHDDPQLTARPAGSRTLHRVVVDWRAELPPSCQLVQTARSQPVLVAVGPEADPGHCQRLHKAGCQLVRCEAEDRNERLLQLLSQLGPHEMTNLLVEGGGTLLGSLFDLGQIDEVHVFVAPKLIGGRSAPVPLAGTGRDRILDAACLEDLVVQQVGQDVYVRGRVAAAQKSPRDR